MPFWSEVSDRRRVHHPRPPRDRRQLGLERDQIRADPAIQGSEALGRINAGQIAEKKLADLLRGPISSALQGPKGVAGVPAAPRPGGSILMQQVQCKVGEAPPAAMTRLACSQQNGEILNP